MDIDLVQRAEATRELIALVTKESGGEPFNREYDDLKNKAILLLGKLFMSRLCDKVIERLDDLRSGEITLRNVFDSPQRLIAQEEIEHFESIRGAERNSTDLTVFEDYFYSKLGYKPGDVGLKIVFLGMGMYHVYVAKN